jgi:nucleoside-diphosphate-sugar epimerase
MSTAKVWGEGRDMPYTERDPPAPEDDYARSKLAAEEGLSAIARETGLEIIILRPPLVYGPGVRANFLSLMKAVDRGLPLPLGAIANRRSLVSVTNLASAVVATISLSAVAVRIFAVSDGEDVSTPELIRRIALALGKPARLVPIAGPLLAAGATLLGRRAAYDRLAGSLTVDSTDIRKTLGWTPPETLDQGLAATARWFRSGKDTTPGAA